MGSSLGRKKWATKGLLTSSREVVSGRLENHGVTLPSANFFAVQIVCRVVSVRKNHECWALAAFTALKYPSLDSLAVVLLCGSLEERAFQDVESNAFQRVNRKVLYHGLGLTDRRRSGV